jgi:hypothetical protein
MATDEPLPIPSAAEDVFEIGERTIYRLQSQASPFDPDELGTMIVRPHPATLDRPAPIATHREPQVDPLERLEDKIDVLARSMEMLQRRLDSIDAQLARLVSR